MPSGTCQRKAEKAIVIILIARYSRPFYKFLNIDTVSVCLLKCIDHIVLLSLFTNKCGSETHCMIVNFLLIKMI